MKVLFIIFIILIILSLLMIYSCCKVSGMISRLEEEKEGSNNERKIEDMNLIEILNYIKFVYGNDETTNLYIRCLDCDKMIPIYEWDEHEQLIEVELCNECISEK